MNSFNKINVSNSIFKSNYNNSIDNGNIDKIYYQNARLQAINQDLFLKDVENLRFLWLKINLIPFLNIYFTQLHKTILYFLSNIKIIEGKEAFLHFSLMIWPIAFLLDFVSGCISCVTTSLSHSPFIHCILCCFCPLSSTNCQSLRSFFLLGNFYCFSCGYFSAIFCLILASLCFYYPIHISFSCFDSEETFLLHARSHSLILAIFPLKNENFYEFL